MHFFPAVIIPYVLFFHECFNHTGCSYFMGFLWGFIACTEKKTLTRIAGSCPFLFRHVSGWSRFLAQSKWSLDALQQRLVEFVIFCFGDNLLFRERYLVAGLDTIARSVYLDTQNLPLTKFLQFL